MNICRFIGLERIKEMRLLYRGSRDGHRGADFHSRCNDKGPTLTVIWDDGGRVFGGFTTLSWAGSGYKDDKQAFLFSVDLNLKYAYKNDGNAIFCN